MFISAKSAKVHSTSLPHIWAHVSNLHDLADRVPEYRSNCLSALRSTALYWDQVPLKQTDYNQDVRKTVIVCGL
jgi:hypothetical protein